MVTTRTETTIEDLCRAVLTEEICDLVHHGADDELIESRIVAELKQHGIEGDVAREYAKPALLGLKQATRQARESDAGFPSTYLSEQQKIQWELVRPHLHEDEVLLCVEQTDRKAPFLIRVLPVVGDLAELTIKRLIIAVTDRRLLVLQLGSKKHQPVVKRVVDSVPHTELRKVSPKRGLLTSSIRIETDDGRKMHFRDLLKSAADRLSQNILKSQP